MEAPRVDLPAPYTLIPTTMTERNENTGTTPNATQNNVGNGPAGTARAMQDGANANDKKEGTPTDQKDRKDAEEKNTPDHARTTAKEDSSNSGKHEGTK